MENPRLRQHALGFLALIDKPASEELSEFYSQNYHQKETGNYRKDYTPLDLGGFKYEVQR